MNNKKREILDHAYTLLTAELGDRLELLKILKGNKDHTFDAEFRVNDQIIGVRVFKEVRPVQVDQLDKLKDQHEHILIAAQYITPNAKKLLKAKGFNYIDRVGNIFFKLGAIHLFIEGIKNQPPAQDKKYLAFTRTGIKVVFRILIEPELINAAYRDIVEKTGVALGTIPKVIKALKEEEFIIKKTEKEWMIKDFDELLNRWQKGFTEQLKPGLFVKSYRANDRAFHVNWRRMKLTPGDRWGGEPAADLLTRHLKPGTFTLYTGLTQADVMKNYKWIPDPEGDIYVYKRFWNDELDYTPQNCVPPVLAYAELAETGDERCMETAAEIYEQYIRKH